MVEPIWKAKHEKPRDLGARNMHSLLAIDLASFLARQRHGVDWTAPRGAPVSPASFRLFLPASAELVVRRFSAVVRYNWWCLTRDWIL